MKQIEAVFLTRDRAREHPLPLVDIIDAKAGNRIAELYQVITHDGHPRRLESIQLLRDKETREVIISMVSSEQFSNQQLYKTRLLKNPPPALRSTTRNSSRRRATVRSVEKCKKHQQDVPMKTPLDSLKTRAVEPHIHKQSVTYDFVIKHHDLKAIIDGPKNMLVIFNSQGRFRIPRDALKRILKFSQPLAEHYHRGRDYRTQTTPAWAMPWRG